MVVFHILTDFICQGVIWGVYQRRYKRQQIVAEKESGGQNRESTAHENRPF
jgi:hypothetical protein